MLLDYIRNVEMEIPFGGIVVHLTLKPMKRADVHIFQATVDQWDRISRYADRLPEYVESHDVRDAAGNPVPTDEWCEAAYFLPLVCEVMVRHLQRALPENPS